MSRALKDHKMKILYVCSILYRDASPGNLRPRRHIGYLASEGYTIHALYESEDRVDITYKLPANVTSSVASRQDDYEKRAIQRVSNIKRTLTIRKKVSPSEQLDTASVSTVSVPQIQSGVPQTTRLSIKSTVLGYLYYRLYIQSAKAWAKDTVAQLQKEGRSFDLTITSYDPLGNYIFGLEAKKRGLTKHWICDLRDTMHDGVRIKTGYLDRILKGFERKAIREADYVTVVSNGQKQMLMDIVGGDAKEADKKIQVIYSGYTEKPVRESLDEDQTLRFVYTGSLNQEQVEALKLFLNPLVGAVKAGQVAAKDVKFIYAGPSSQAVQKLFHDYDLQDILDDRGLVSRKDVSAVQNEADCLLMTTYNYKDSQGILTGKFFDYLSIHKPIVCMVSGDLPNSEVAELIRNYRLGMVVEAASDGRRQKEFADQLLRMVRDKANGNRIAYAPDVEGLNRLSEPHVCRELVELCRSLDK